MAEEATPRPASEVLKDLKDTLDMKITLLELSAVLGTKSTLKGADEVTYDTKSLKRRIINYRRKHAPKTAPSEETASTPPAKKTARRSTKQQQREARSKRATSSGPASSPKIVTSNTPPDSTRTPAGEKTAGALIDYLEEVELVPEYPIPGSLEQFRRAGIEWIRGWTLDGEKFELTMSEAVENQERRDDMSYPVPLFSRERCNHIVALVAKLDGAPGPDAVDEAGMKLFPNKLAWRSNMLQIGIRIWGRKENPPSLVINDYPHRRYIEGTQTRIPPTTFRYRSTTVGFVSRLKEAFDREAFTSGLTGSRLREFKADWLDQFIARERSVSFGPGQGQKTMLDFRLGRNRPGTGDELKMIWDMVVVSERKKVAATRARSSSTSRTPQARARRSR